MDDPLHMIMRVTCSWKPASEQDFFVNFICVEFAEKLLDFNIYLQKDVY